MHYPNNGQISGSLRSTAQEIRIPRTNGRLLPGNIRLYVAYAERAPVRRATVDVSEQRAGEFGYRCAGEEEETIIWLSGQYSSAGRAGTHVYGGHDQDSLGRRRL